MDSRKANLPTPVQQSSNASEQMSYAETDNN
jgi:hypothetical protein